jgi:hypothetical protein
MKWNRYGSTHPFDNKFLSIFLENKFQTRWAVFHDRNELRTPKTREKTKLLPRNPNRYPKTRGDELNSRLTAQEFCRNGIIQIRFHNPHRSEAPRRRAPAATLPIPISR